MQGQINNRRGFLRRLAAVVGGMAAIPVLARPAQAGRSRYRGGWGYGGFRGYPGYGGYGYRRVSSHRRYWGGGVPYGGYGGGYYGGFGRGLYGGGLYSPFQGGVAPYNFYNGGYYPPILKLQKSKVMDPLALLEC